ncbi:hypothetical protein PsYK624_034140 [Phanerochaete sordida]|uniref:Pentacotripeptide-repeat region of PRORP domain-containing protein n=1 Tax=Phanerochaete sordida TaxID=48140 RepID=A0A9P3G328_9APHY|nr:hypothetical protein PsYK624_034140 [Phanerochaete sordida]
MPLSVARNIILAVTLDLCCMRTWARFRPVAARVSAPSCRTLRSCRLLWTGPPTLPTLEEQGKPHSAARVDLEPRYAAPLIPDALLQKLEPPAPDRPIPWIRRLAADVKPDEDEDTLSVLTLSQAMALADRRAIPRLWDARRQSGPLAPGAGGGEALFEEFEAYTVAIEKARLARLDEPSIAALDEIAVYAAALGLSHGARAMMDHHLTVQNPDRALDVAIRVHRLLEERNSQLHAGAEDLAISMHSTLLSRAILACIANYTFSPLLQLSTLVVGSNAIRTIPSPALWQLELTRAARAHGIEVARALSWAHRLYTLAFLKLPIEEYDRLVSKGPGHKSVAADQLHLPRFTQNIIRELSDDDSHITVDPEAATSSTQPLLLFSPAHWAILLRALIHRRDLHPSYTDLANTLNRRMCEPYSRKPPVVDAAVIEGLTLLGCFNEARRAWSELRYSHGEPGAAVYRAYIGALLAEGATEKALRTLNHFESRIRTSGVDPAEASAAASVFTTVIAWHADRDELDAAHAVLTRMAALGLPSDATPYNLLLARYAEHTDLAPFWALLRTMDARSVPGDLDTAALVLLAARDTDERAPLLAVARLVQWGLAHDTAACTALLQRLVRARTPAALGAAERLLAHMRRAAAAGRAPDRHAYALVLAAVERAAARDPAGAAGLRAALAAGMAESRLVLEDAAGATLLVVRACCEDPARGGLARAMEYYGRYKAARRHPAVYRPLWEVLAGEVVRRGEWVYVDELKGDCTSKQMRNSKTVQKLLQRMKKGRGNTIYLGPPDTGSISVEAS